MKKPSLVQDDTDILLSGALMGEPNELASVDVQRELQLALLEKLKEDQSEKTRRKEIRKRQQELIAKEAQKRRESEIAAQAACTHLKQNGSPAVVGMYNHSNDLMCFCQNCGKEWIKNNCPAHLLPPSGEIGGPGVR